jgi:aminopeptidase N
MHTETGHTAEAPKTIYLKDYKKPDFLVSHVDMTFQLFDGRTDVHTVTSFTRDASDAATLFLHGQDLTLKSIKLNGVELSESKDYTLHPFGMTISIPQELEEFQLSVETEIVPEENTALEGLYKSGGNYTTQCEAEGFRKITYFQDRPDVMSLYTVRIEADKAQYTVLLSNGNLAAEGDLEGGRHYATWHDPFPKPCYLFALVAGDLVCTDDKFTTMSGREVALKIYTRDGDQGQVAHAMKALKDSMKWDEDAYGREYDLDLFNIVAVSDFNMGAMENKSLNIFNTQLVLAHSDTASDQDFLNVERVIGHEYFHNWSGNRVTCRDWFQLSLKEGFTVFRENQFGQAMNDPMVERIDEVKLVRGMQFPEDASPMAHPIRPESYIEINNFYTVTVYEKGGEVIRMLSLILGDKLYRKATDLYFDRHDGQAATCDQFVQAMEDASNIDLKQFRLWYSQAGTPRVTMVQNYDEQARRLTLSFTQTIPDTPRQSDKKPMHIPIALGLLDRETGADIPLHDGLKTQVLNLTEARQDFTFENIESCPVISALRGFSAPVILDTDLTDDDLRFLMVHDSDGFNRWEAGQTLALRMLKNMMSEGSKTNAAYVDALKGAIEALGHDQPALLARVLALPDDSILAQNITPIDPQAIKAARDAAMHDIATALYDPLMTLYKVSKSKNDGSDTSAKVMGWRSLMNIVLRLLDAADHEAAMALAKDQYEHAGCMTERLGALSLFANDPDHAISKECFLEFYERFKDYELVVNKWFALQAGGEHDNIIETVRGLMQHPEFTLKNPNRVRSLIAGFAMRNMVMFHHESGGGYKVLREVVQELNTLNPQIASRMLTPMRQWKSYKAELASMMEAELEKLKATPNLSPDVFEVVTKALDAS